MVDFDPRNYNDPFTADLVEFISADDFQDAFESFFLTHATKFSYDDEHKLEYTKLYQEFSQLFENKIKNFCISKKLDDVEFYRKCKKASLKDPEAKRYIDIMLSSVEYETFVKLMKIMRPVAEIRQSVVQEAEPKSSSGKNSSEKLYLNETKLSEPLITYSSCQIEKLDSKDVESKYYESK
jgi:hypothetical protein